MKLRPIQPLLVKIEQTVNERLTQMQILQNHRKFPEIIKDEELKSQTRRNLRLIKQHQLLRISEEDRAIAEIPSLKYFSKENTLMLEQMLVNLMNKYLKSQFTAIKRGLFQDLVIIFQKYYYHISYTSKLRQMVAIRNQNIVQQVDFARKNILVFVINTRSSMNSLLNKQRLKFYHASRDTPKQIPLFRQSPEKRNVISVDINDIEARRMSNKKKLYSNYVSQMSKLLSLESGAMSNAAYFQKSESLDNERKMSLMEMNFIKKNQEVKESISTYSASYTLKLNS